MQLPGLGFETRKIETKPANWIETSAITYAARNNNNNNNNNNNKMADWPKRGEIERNRRISSAWFVVFQQESEVGGGGLDGYRALFFCFCCFFCDLLADWGWWEASKKARTNKKKKRKTNRPPKKKKGDLLGLERLVFGRQFLNGVIGQEVGRH